MARTKKAKKIARPRTRRRKARAANGAVAAAGQIMVVNMVPKSLSRETNQDSEPTIAVNPANPLQIAGSAFTPDPSGGSLAPIYVSTDGGATWRLNAVVPSIGGSSVGTSDISVAFASTGGRLYGGILRDPSDNFETLRTTSFLSSTAMQVLGSRPDNDQPFTHALSKSGRDRVLVGNNDFQAGSQTATVDVSANGRVANPVFNKVRIEVRNTSGQNGPQVRPIAHNDGTAYAIFYGWRSESGSFPGNTLVVTSDVVVVRDDRGGNLTFADLTDPSDGLAGRLLARGARVPFQSSGTASTGQQRLGGTLSIAVDPRAGKSGRIVAAWADRPLGSILTIHVRASIDRGVTWSPNDLLTLPNATNAALAINRNGVVGLLYQQLTGTGSSRRWVTHFRRSDDGINWSDVVLANTSATSPAKTFDPYLGDYDHLVAVGVDFFGIFSANNTPNLTNFPNGVTYQRNHDFAAQRLLGLDNTTPVAVSVDPFFFKVTG